MNISKDLVRKRQSLSIFKSYIKERDCHPELPNGYFMKLIEEVGNFLKLLEKIKE